MTVDLVLIQIMTPIVLDISAPNESCPTALLETTFTEIITTVQLSKEVGSADALIGYNPR